MNKIYVGNLPFDTNEATIEELFQQFGEISEVAIIRDRDSGRSRGFGFVTFATPDAAQSALSLDGQDFGGRPMVVNIAKEREERPRRFGGGRGGERRGGRY